ncbi:MAG: helix-turn-helix domain-containing protein [Xenococcaceae cyanobacterium]
MKVKIYLEFEGLGERLKQARMEKGISQAELARRLGVTRAWISHLEAESPTGDAISSELLLKILEELK